MLNKIEKFLGLTLIVLALGIFFQGFLKGLFVSKQIDSLKVFVPLKGKMPDPANIENTGQWYLLDHVSSSLAHYDHIKGRFEPMLANIESFSSGVHSFTLQEDAQFNDGTKITALDIVASIKRLLILKTSTHFPLWDYIEGCENIKSMKDDCPGLKAVSERRVDIRLKVQVEDFNLQLASPETGIWYHGDIKSDSKNLEIQPTKFSGPYSIELITEKSILLKRNDKNPISKAFPDSPKAIEFKIMNSDKAFENMKSGEVDVFVRSHNPYDENDPKQFNYEVFSSAPSSLLYLHGTGSNKRQLVPRKWVEQMWLKNTDLGIVAADNFLPFDPSLALKRNEFLSLLPEQASRKIRIGVPWTYLSQGFYDFLKKSASESGIELDIVSLTPPEWQKGLLTDESPQGVDYILGIYAASERYPAVQLRYITGKVRGPDIDLKLAETPDLSEDKKEILRNYQKALLESQFAVPLFFSRHQMTYKNTLNIGDQPPSDAEIELWRVTNK